MPDDTADYVTVIPAVRYKWFNVVIMAWNKEEYRPKRVSYPMKQWAANALAESWAAVNHLEIR